MSRPHVRNRSEECRDESRTRPQRPTEPCFGTATEEARTKAGRHPAGPHRSEECRDESRTRPTEPYFGTATEEARTKAGRHPAGPLRLVLWSWLLLASCTTEFPAAYGDAEPKDSAADEARPDVLTPDSQPADGASPDGALPDAQPPDAQDLDALIPDAQSPDAQVLDAQPPDAERRDADPLDASHPDVLEPDACAPVDEVCNGLDDDCNGAVDDLEALGRTCWVGINECARQGTLRCLDDALICDAVPGEPHPEACNGVDDDCDGIIDNPSAAGDDCTVGVGACARAGILLCDFGTEDLACNARPGAPGVERCNGQDDDCDGVLDNAPGTGLDCLDGLGECQVIGVTRCHPRTGMIYCEATQGIPSEETCNGLDDDCNGLIDDLPELGILCEAGFGPCRAQGLWRCDGKGVWCDAQVGQPEPEQCNSVDDDCNGITDDAEGVGELCYAGVGQCVRAGARICDVRSRTVVCGAVAGEPLIESCNGLDDNCDGVIDDVADIGRPCTAGLGICQRDGVLYCDAASQQMRCDAALGVPVEEICNGLDDNCDGEVDNVTGLGEACGAGVGGCFRPGVQICDPDGNPSLYCDAQAGAPTVEICNGIDDDCDGTADDVVGVGEGCSVGIGSCQRSGAQICDVGLGRLRCDAVAGPSGAEACNGLDDDCDGVIDNGSSCGTYLTGHCRAWLGYADNNAGPQTPAGSWGDCYGAFLDNGGDTRCVATNLDQNFWALKTKGNVDANDWLGISFTCADNDQPTLAAWFQQHCEVFLAHADVNQPDRIDALNPLSCATSSNGNPSCVRSNGDGLFHPIKLSGDVNGDDSLGIAFRCQDSDAARAQAATAAIKVYLASYNRGRTASGACRAARGTPASWGDCPAQDVDNSGADRCVSTYGDGAFHHFTFDEDVRECHQLAVSIKPR